MTKNMRDMLRAFADGSDVNLTAQLAKLAGKRQEHNTARTILALYKAGMLQSSKLGGLEISAKGLTEAAKAVKAATPTPGLGGQPR